MSADISNLANLQAGEPLDYDIYTDAKEAPPLPPKGRYIFRASDKIAFGATKQNFLSAQIDPTIADGPHAGYTVRFARVSAKPFKRGNAMVSQAGDYLRAVYGTNGPRPQTPQEQMDAIRATQSQSFQAEVDWEAYDKETKYTLSGMTKFPKLPSGEYSEWTEVPGTEKLDDEGKPIAGTARKVRAQARIERFVPLTQ